MTGCFAMTFPAVSISMAAWRRAVWLGKIAGAERDAGVSTAFTGASGVGFPSRCAPGAPGVRAAHVRFTYKTLLLCVK